MFQLTLTEIPDAPPRFVIDPEQMPPMEISGTGKLRVAEPILQIGNAQPFKHFEHNFRELPAQKIQQIIALITKPPRAARSDKGRKKQKGADTPALPGT